VARSRRRQETLESVTPPSLTGARTLPAPVTTAVGSTGEPTLVDTITSPSERTPSAWSRHAPWPLRRLGAWLGGRVGRRTRSLLVAFLVVVCAGSWAVDQHRRSDEFNVLIAAARSGQATIDDSDRRVASMIDYVSPLLHALRTPPDVRAGLQQVVHDAAVMAAAELRAAARRVAAIPVWSWHPAQVAARDAYVADLRARATYYDQFMTPGVTNNEFAQESAIQTDWAAARAAFLSAATNAAQQDQVDLVLTH
jgi:hypothetical protein